MPTRYIKESARTSKNLGAVEDFSERLFWRLITTADDFGRFLGCPVIVKSTCFPLLETLKSSKVEGALQDLATHDLIQLYQVGDREYGVFLNWTRHQGEPRAKGSKYPDPPLLPTSADICGHPPTQVPGASDTDTDSDLNSPSSPNLHLKSNGCAEEFEEFWKVYPRKTGKKDALKAWKKAKDRPALAVVLQCLSVARASEQWNRDGGQYIPNPATWLNQGRWDDQPVAKAATTMESFLSRQPYRKEVVQ